MSQNGGQIGTHEFLTPAFLFCHRWRTSVPLIPLKFKIICRFSEPVDCSHIFKLCDEGAPPNVINAEICKLGKKAMKGEEFKLYVGGKLFDYAPFHLQKRLDHICVICGRVPNEGERLRATMVS
jgi:hypothetical protein